MDFWADHGKALAGIIMLIVSIGTLIFKQGRLVQRIETAIKSLKTFVENKNKAQDAKIDKNCLAVANAIKELQALKDSKLLTHPDHHILTIDCRKEITRQMSAQKESITKDVKSISETMYEMRMDMKEDRKVRQKQAEKLVEYDVILHGFREDLKGLRS